MDWLRRCGFSDAEVTGSGADGGVDVDVRSDRLVAQVKAELRPVGRPVIQQIFGIASAEGRSAACFTLSGFTSEATDWANGNGVALLVFDYEGAVEAVNAAASQLIEVGTKDSDSTPFALSWIDLGRSFPEDQEALLGWVRHDNPYAPPQIAWSVSDTKTKTSGWYASVEPGVASPPDDYWASNVGVERWPFGIEVPQFDGDPHAMFVCAAKEFSGFFDSVERAFEALDTLYGGAGVHPEDFRMEYTPRMTDEEKQAAYRAETDTQFDSLEPWQQIVEFDYRGMQRLLRDRASEGRSTEIRGVWPQVTRWVSDSDARRAKWTRVTGHRPDWRLYFVRLNNGKWVRLLQFSVPADVIPRTPPKRGFLKPRWSDKTIDPVGSMSIGDYLVSWSMEVATPREGVAALREALDLCDLGPDDFRIVVARLDDDEREG
jgi:hypothetical protein